jgi:imidazolonepropionase-like amidohydrolase
MSLLSGLALLLQAGGQPIPQPHLALVRANVVDVRSGAITAKATVVLHDGKIASVGPGPAPAGAEVIDLEGRYVLPGLMDAHTHLDDLDRARRALHSGITTLRGASVGSYRDVVIGEMSKAGYIAGPDYLGAGVYVTPYIEDGVLAAGALMKLAVPVVSEEDLRALVRINVENGARVIKTRGTERAGRPDTDPREQVYTERQLRAVVEEAARLGVAVLCHAHGDEGARAAILAGVRSIEHGTYMSDETLRLMKERGTYFVPTYTTMIDLLEPGGDYDDPVVKIRGLHMLPRIEDTFRRAYDMGIPIVTGADSAYGPESISRITMEMVNFVKLGMKPLEAIQSATLRAAELLQIEKETGSIEPGLEADLIVIEKNPLEDIRVIQDVLIVISNGRIGMNRLPFGKTGPVVSRPRQDPPSL